MFLPEDTFEHPCDVTLVVEDGKEFKAHKDVLSKASIFFEKLLNSDMKESREGVVRLERFSESVMAATLEFIYCDSVRKSCSYRCEWILTQEMAQGLIVMADYLILPSLKSRTEEVLMRKCNSENCISYFYFAEQYQCKQLLAKARKVIFANFTVVSKTEAFLNLSNKEVEMWISSDEVNVTTEEDVFKVILAWIKHDKSMRKKYFSELFRHVRLVHVTPDYLRSDVVTNDLVKDNEDCLDLVKNAMFLIDSKNYHAVRPRKSLESAFIVVIVEECILGYFPEKDTWCKLGENDRYKVLANHLVPYRGKLYCTHPPLEELLCCDPLSNTWTTLPFTEQKTFRQLFVSKEEEMYALMSHPLDRTEKDLIEMPLYITKYKPESNSWEDISLLKFEMESLSSREGMCILAKGSLIYFIGGKDTQHTALKDVYRYDITEEKWDKLADLHKARYSACGAWANGKMYVAGGFKTKQTWSNKCEVYDERTDIWQLIDSTRRFSLIFPKIFSIGDRLYISIPTWHGIDSPAARIDCYDSVKNRWNLVTEKTCEICFDWKTAFARRHNDIESPLLRVNAYPTMVFKGLLDMIFNMSTSKKNKSLWQNLLAIRSSTHN